LRHWITKGHVGVNHYFIFILKSNYVYEIKLIVETYIVLFVFRNLSR
jgi:hypothetical protein